MSKEVERYLAELHRCSANVIVAGATYKSKGYACDIVAPAIDLARWAERHAKRVTSSDNYQQAARLALPIWLSGADQSDASFSVVPSHMERVLSPYAEDFVVKGFAGVWCIECGTLYSEIDRSASDKSVSGSTTTWNSEWHCPQGHLVRKEDHEVRFF